VNQTSAVPPTIRRAGPDERDAVAAVIGEAFFDDPVSGWVFPDPRFRRAVHAHFFGQFVDLALREGWVDVAGDLGAAALWLPPTGHADSEAGADSAQAPDDLGARLAAIAGNERPAILDELTAAVHPAEPHYYLPIIGAHPDHQGTGLGRALITHVTDRCDREGVAAYLEASNPRSKALYERLGFVFTGKTVDLPGGPPMWPMWREPRG
jgi:GNAT superfamily N-acetyltransferase